MTFKMCNCPEEPKSDIIKKCAGKFSKKKTPSRERDLEIAKSILQRRSNYSGDNVFDHLCDLIKRIIDEDPPSVVDCFEDYSRIVREEKFHMLENNFVNSYKDPHSLQYAVNIMKSFQISLYPEIVPIGEEEEQKPEEVDEPVYTPTTRDVMHLQFYWSLCGFGVSEEGFLLSHSIEKFEKHPAISSCRFWGKMFGLKANYYVLEAAFTQEEIAKRVQQMKYDMMEKARIDREEDGLKQRSEIPRPDLFPGMKWKGYPEADIAKMNIKQPPLPKNDYKRPLDIPPEIIGKGLNRYAYFVCTDPLEEWIELPIVTPKQIGVSRNIKKFLTGNLEAPVVSYPLFPGKEKHYLRAIIARISAGTHISPAGFMKIGKERSPDIEGEEEEEEEEEAEEEEEGGSSKINNDKPIIENKKYKPLPVRNLLDMQNWQHTRPAILTQGRVAVYDEKKYRKEFGLDGGENEEDEEEEEEVEEEEDEDEEGKKPKLLTEKAPALFTAINEDTLDFNIPSWSLRKSNCHNAKNMVVIAKSNVWPGAFSFAMENVVDNLYIGWGNKYEVRNMSPPPLPDIQEEYSIGPEILEILDPSAKDEEDWRIAHLKIKSEHHGEEIGREEDLNEEGEEEEDEED